MVFSSILFVYYFLPIFVLGYIVIPKKHKNVFALIGSLLFYAWASPQFFIILFLAATADHLLITRALSSNNQKQNKRVLIFGISLNFLLLAYFKYANFFIENVNAFLLELGFTQVEWTQVALPVGISFFTFQKASFLIDTYRQEKLPKLTYINYLLYVFFFPQLIAGPIIRFKEISEQIVQREENYIKRLEGFNRFCIGLAKKVLLADSFAVYADLTFNNVNSIGFANAWIGALAYTFQIYFDFSGYSDMAIGLGKMAGFKFPENFNFPYSSASIAEFWRRWHITLSTWMKDYLYIPLGGNRGSEKRTFINLWVVFLFSGIWHGAGWNYIIWGGYHGFWLVLERLGLSKFLKKIGPFAQLSTFVIVVIGWVFFRADTLSDATTYLSKMFSFNSEQTTDSLPTERAWWLIAIGVITLLMKYLNIETVINNLTEFTSKKQLFITSFFVLILLIYATGEMAASGFSPFIYFRF